MKRLSANELRQMYLEFFESKGHKILPSASLIPRNDPTLLLTGAGMVPFKPFFLGKAKPDYTRVTTCQKCVRTADIDNVGRTDRHATFFEMLGNFSFGDYFKKEAISWAWEFVTEHLLIDKQRLWASIYLEDDEAFEIWNKQIGLPADRIVRLGKKDNFWEIGVGPCGPCSEIYLDRGEQFGCGEEDCRPGCDCERYLEFWNLVFIQFYRDEGGSYTPLERKGIDTGMGLDRTAAMLQGAKSIFETDLMRPIVARLEELSGIKYGSKPDSDVSLRIISDHIRGLTFMVSDGITPGNEGRGYVLRRLLRRASRHGRRLGLEGPFLDEAARAVVDVMSGAYPELAEKSDYIFRVISMEEDRFRSTLDQGMSILEDLIDKAKAESRSTLSGKEIFRLYDTYGFPYDLSKEIAGEEGLEIDEAEFKHHMEEQRIRARAARKQMGYLGDTNQLYVELSREVNSRFVGYETTVTEAEVVALLKDGAPVQYAEVGDHVELVLSVTPFYAESGGQVSDTGTITGVGGQARVNSVDKPAAGVISHSCSITSGRISVRDTVMATVDRRERRDTERNHTATHLLHRALRDALGEHARQSGSLVTPDRLRFDFTHFEPLSQEQLDEVEKRVNDVILENIPVTALEMDREEALKAGAVALFDEKYGDRVRVVSVGDYSRELCGGTHVRATGEIGLFKIVSEFSVAAGIRRIEALTGKAAIKQSAFESRLVKNLASRLGCSPEEIESRIDRLQADIKHMEKELARTRLEAAGKVVERAVAAAQNIDGFRVVVELLEGADAETLRSVGDETRARLGSGVVVIGSNYQGKALFVAMATDDAVKSGINCGEIVRQAAKVTGGGGGGRPDMAQAGGKNPELLKDALERARAVIQSQVISRS